MKDFITPEERLNWPRVYTYLNACMWLMLTMATLIAGLIVITN